MLRRTLCKRGRLRSSPGRYRSELVLACMCKVDLVPSPLSLSMESASVANRHVLFPTVRCRRTCSSFPAVWHVGDGILDLCLPCCFSSSASSNFRRTAAGTRCDKIMPFGRLFLRIPMAALVPSTSPPRRVSRASFLAGYPRIVLGLSGGHRFSLRGSQYCGARPGTAANGSGRNDAVDLRIDNGHAGRRGEPRQQILLGSGAETTCL